MLNKGFITQLILIAIFAASAVLINKLFSKEPNTLTAKAVNSITKYPNSTNWQINSKPKLCIYYINQCQEAPSTITFTSDNNWANIYTFYKNELGKYAWQTNSRIVTSIPSSIILKNDVLFENSTCEFVAKEKGRSILDLDFRTQGNTFIISIMCTQVK